MSRYWTRHTKYALVQPSLLTLMVLAVCGFTPGFAQNEIERGLLRVTVSSPVEIFHESLLAPKVRIPQMIAFPGTWLDERGNLVSYVGVRVPELTSRNARITVETYDGQRFPAELVGIDERISLAVIQTGNVKRTAFSFHTLPKSGGLELASLGRDAWNRFIGSIVKVEETELLAEHQVELAGLDRVARNVEGSLVLDKGNRFVGIVSRTKAHPFSKKLRILQVIPASVIRESASRILKSRTNIRAGWLGVNLAPAKEGGAIVEMVFPETPAQKAGLLVGDHIVRVKDRPVSWAHLLGSIQWAGAGADLPIQIKRQGQLRTVSARLTERQDSLPRMSWELHFSERWEGREPAPEAIRMRPVIPPFPVRLGFELDPLSEQLAQYFKSPTGQGLLVKQVIEKSMADQAGFKAGDVLIQINDSVIGNNADVFRVLERNGQNSTLEIRFVRDGQVQQRRLVIR